jgi:hypothetical protein
MLKILKVPMQKLSTSKIKTDLKITQNRLENSQSLQPKTETLNKILQFASAYRVEKTSENQYIELYLN